MAVPITNKGRHVSKFGKNAIGLGEKEMRRGGRALVKMAMSRGVASS
jgi:hypothetical protein